MSQQSKRKPAKKAITGAQSVPAWQTEAFLRFTTGLVLVLAIYVLASVFGL
jgi:hypothetical protein